MEDEIETRIVEAGQIVKIGGIPFRLTEDAKLSSHKENWDIAFEIVKKPTEKSVSP